MGKSPLIQAVNLAGGQVALAAGIRARMPGSNIRQGHIWKWLNRQLAPVPPAEYVIAIAQHLDWRITPHQLRPDLYPNPADAMPHHAASRGQQTDQEAA